TQSLSITLWTRHTKITTCALFGITPFLVTNDHTGQAIKACQAADNSLIVGIHTIAVQLVEISKQEINIIKGVRPLWMPCDQCNLPRSQLGINVFCQGLTFLL